MTQDETQEKPSNLRRVSAAEIKQVRVPVEYVAPLPSEPTRLYTLRLPASTGGAGLPRAVKAQGCAIVSGAARLQLVAPHG